ncbi:hypothetical protein C8D87_104419 [Lentzea atacamensis]|uniref:LPXTG-motif cell wall anchor domain-containing protein n=1 Tax=Lentzea atacamensis TaxID=531938 RepID=A0ABX9E9W5_9PSEU|nr:hypothetical protein [Lentzea atacamensis]RAS65868.1 hypothetical protein C8D87_104419 [Lentzea atacamensis]
MLVSLYVTCYGIYELRLFLGDADPADPVIDAASALQSTLVDRLTASGSVPALLVLVALLSGAALLVRNRHKARK